jgi:hypothetical protein
MQKLARTLRAAAKPRKLIQTMPAVPAIDDQRGRFMMSADAIAGLAGAAAAVSVLLPGRLANTTIPPSSSAMTVP